jgi:hypothetical protein
MEKIVFSRALSMTIYILWISHLVKPTWFLAYSQNHQKVGYGIGGLLMLE